ncbi:TrmH family RNA methyltransferase [Ureaplasma canigenitalium]|uniref:TrmH family RNA methyltransferase n=1 Tax=Ureaplasma canigenitalium TaxID=42092 RepID=UPI0004E2723E|nr:RNA methyltransferase [Ureaplasma canigenitalium]
MKLITITSSKNPIVNHFQSIVVDKQYRMKHRLILVENEKLIDEALKMNYRLKNLLVYDVHYKKNFEKCFRFTLCDDVEVYLLTDTIMKKISSNESFSKVMAVIEMPFHPVSPNDPIIVLDNIQDPGNLGTILRSCVAFKMTNLVLSNCVDLYNNKVIKASMGAIFKINTLSFKNDEETLRFLTENEYYQVGCTIASDAKKISQYRFKNDVKYAFLFGNEGHGLHQNFINHVDEKLMIPISNTESLNVSTAASVIIYEWYKQCFDI